MTPPFVLFYKNCQIIHFFDDTPYSQKPLINSLLCPGIFFSLPTQEFFRGQGKIKVGRETKKKKNEALLCKFLKESKGFAGWDESHPLYPVLDKMLSEADPNYKESNDIKWNFTKFLINKKGQVVARFEPTTNFEVIAKAIEEWLSK